MVPIAAPARRRSLRRAAAPAEVEVAHAPRRPGPSHALLLTLLLPACSIGLTESDTLAEPALPVEPLTIVDADVVYTDADDEDLETPGLQVTLRVDVADEAIDEVVLFNQADGTDLSDPVREDLDGRRVALFLITLPLVENPVRATAPSLRLETHAVVRAVGPDAPGR